MIQKPSFVIPYILFSCLLIGQGRSSPPESCREVTNPVWYKYNPGHIPAGLGTSSIVRVDARNGKVAVVIHVGDVAEIPYYGSISTFRSQDCGHTWHAEPRNIPSPLAVFSNDFVEAPSNPAVLYRYLHDIGLYLRSEDGGKTWVLPKYSVDGKSKKDFVLQRTKGNSHHIEFRHAAVHPYQPLTLYATIRMVPWTFSATELPVYELPGMYVSFDGGETWAKFTNELRNTSPLGISPSDPNVMFGHGVEGVVKTADGGKHWIAVGQQKELEAAPLYSAEKKHKIKIWGAPRGLEISQFVIGYDDDRIIYVVSNKGIYRSMDGGNTWCLLDLGFDVVDSYYSLALNPKNSKEVFVGTRYGVFYSHDRGSNWRRIYPSEASKPD